MDTTNGERSSNVALTVIAVAVTIMLLQFMQTVLITFLLSVLLFHALDWPVDRMQRMKVPRALGAALMLAVTVAGAAALAFALQNQVRDVVDQLPTGARRLARALERKPNAEATALEKVEEAADALATTTGPKTPPGVMRVQVEEPRFRANQYIWENSASALSAVNQLFIVLFLTYFMLLSDRLFRKKLIAIAGPTLARRKVTLEILEQIADRIKQFMLIQIATSAIVAVLTWLALWALGLHQAALWGLVAGVLNSIPYYGPMLVTGGLSIVGFLQFGDIPRTMSVAGVSLLITTLEGSLITPQLMGRAAEMNSVAVFAGLLFWSWVWGIWGLLLAVPIMMVIKVVCDHVEDLQAVGHLLGSEPETPTG